MLYELLAHLVLSDVIRWLAVHSEFDLDTCGSVLDWLEREYVRGSEDVRDLIGVSGIEMVPNPGQVGAVLRDRLGLHLRDLDPWRDQ